MSANKRIGEICSSHNWKFINNDNITQRLIAPDGVHLGRIGITVYARNVIRHLRGFPPIKKNINFIAIDDKSNSPPLTSRLQSRKTPPTVQSLFSSSRPTHRPHGNSNPLVPKHQDFHHHHWKSRNKHQTPSRQARHL